MHWYPAGIVRVVYCEEPRNQFCQSIQVHAKIGFSQRSHIDQSGQLQCQDCCPVLKLRITLFSLTASVFEASRVLIIFCIGGAVLVIGTPLEYVQGSRCDLVAPCFRLCLTLLNLRSCAMERAACVEEERLWFLMLGPSSTIFTIATSTFGT